ncbi:dermonecrotic toxin domain-containing protein [Pseudomonas sp. R2-37-08W]|uniref:dermonecrotic toxin domain-containing protein n=1 Tax=Pseudomonas sp. R2-37-08W TaxID=1173273 RepID=UPI000F56B293|nr:DUF6543 domain-containing protein [Pseudomonas sp. R2-37-08W]
MRQRPVPVAPDIHHAILTQAIPHWLGDAAPARRSALGEHAPSIPDWYKHACDAQHAELKRLNGEAWTRQNQVDKALAELKSPEMFGAELLQAALKRQYALDLDVRSTWLQLYVPLTLAGVRVRAGASRTWSVSLLKAALHNFEPAEAEPDAYEQNSGFSTQPNAAGHFQSLPAIAARISVAQFATLCRELDIGGRYQRYLEDYLGLGNPVAEAVLQARVEQSQASALKLSLYMALLKGDIPQAGYDAVHSLISHASQRPALMAHELVIMSSRLVGIVVFSPHLDSSRAVAPVIAYIPDDPQHPIKQYPSAQAFMQALTARLRSTDFQHFFSRFVSHADIGSFFADLNRRLSEVTWHLHTPGDPLPSWRETEVDRPKLEFRGLPIKQPLFQHLYQMKLSKLRDDASSQAVSTAAVNRKARWERWDLVQKIGSALLQVAALIASPFVPPLGLLMLGYTAYQLLDEAFEGVIDWAEGLTREAFGHTMGFVEQLVQLGLFATGIPIAQGLLRKVLPGECLGFLNGLTPVTTAEGGQRLWKPDLAPYRVKFTPPKTVRPDPQGLYRYNGKILLPLDGDYYSLQQDPASLRYSLRHPSRPAAYAPRLLNNGQGAWITEMERPLNWDNATLMRRLGYRADGLSDARLRQAHSVSGTHDNALRKMHMRQQTLPPLLADTLKRFKIDQALQDFITQMNSDDPGIYRQADIQTQLQVLTSNGLWPVSRTLRLVDSNGNTQWEFAGQSGAHVVQVRESQLKNGELLRILIDSLDEPERKLLLEEPADLPARTLTCAPAPCAKKSPGLPTTNASTCSTPATAAKNAAPLPRCKKSLMPPRNAGCPPAWPRNCWPVPAARSGGPLTSARCPPVSSSRPPRPSWRYAPPVLTKGCTWTPSTTRTPICWSCSPLNACPDGRPTCAWNCASTTPTAHCCKPSAPKAPHSRGPWCAPKRATTPRSMKRGRCSPTPISTPPSSRLSRTASATPWTSISARANACARRLPNMYWTASNCAPCSARTPIATPL